MRRTVAILAVVLLLLAAGATYAWRHVEANLEEVRLDRRTSPTSASTSLVPPLERNWQAAVAVLAGDGVRGAIDDVGTRARFSEPFGIAAAPDGTIFVADAGWSDRIRRVTRDGRVSTVAGGVRGFADGPGDRAQFRTPSGLAVAPDGSLYVADTGNHAIRRITPDGQVTTVAGNGTPGFADGAASDARFDGPIGIAVARDGRIVVADTYNDRIRIIDASGAVTTLAGSGQPGAGDGVADAASFDTPAGVALDAHGLLYVADTGNNAVRIVDGNGTVTTPSWAYGNGFFRPLALAVAPDGELYVADEGGRIVAIRGDGDMRTLAGDGAGFHDGPGWSARFRRPSGLALLRPGHLAVADAGNALVRTVGSAAQLGLQPPTSPFIHPAFDTQAFNWVPLLWPVAPFSGPHEVAGTFGEVRGRGSERFHLGVDVRIEEGTDVSAVRDGIVSSPISNGGIGTLDEYLRIGDLTYVHIRAGRSRTALLDTSRFVATYDGRKLKRLRVKRGARFDAGELVGTVNRFNHVHLTVGWPAEEYNPLQFRLTNFEDTVPPTIDGIRVYDEAWNEERADGRQTRLPLAGRVHLVVEAYDQTDDNTPSRRLAPYEVGYQLLKADGSPAAGFETRHASIRFDHVTPEPYAPHRVYAAGSGIPFYGGRRTRFRYIVTNQLHDGQTSEGLLDTDHLPSGDYVIRAWALDISGNLSERDLPVTLGRPPADQR